ncbi:Ig-like domain-containing protein [Hydrogenovibrio kuenenii]|uniref:Ig-like domain-containing protein n=1 Tax=Hydrogenovibrio kuenenii TaxID=63658 RepID=UPI000465C077|nr:Ig-like domain-containing protein [Hydrogenovibrio kuenenii]
MDVAGSDLAADADKGFTASVASTDAAGNPVTSTATHSYTVDTTADKGTVTINDVTSDNVINAAESGQTIAVTGTATGGDISANDTVTMTINGQEYTATVQSNGTWSVDVSRIRPSRGCRQRLHSECCVNGCRRQPSDEHSDSQLHS